MLAFTTFDLASGSLTVEFDAQDTLVSIGSQNHELTITSHSTSVETAGDTYTIELDKIARLLVTGSAYGSHPQRLVFTDSIDASNAPALTTVSIRQVDSVYFLGQLEMAGNLSISLDASTETSAIAVIEPPRIRQSRGSHLFVGGDTSVHASSGNVDLNGQNDFVGSVSVSVGEASRFVRLNDVNGLVLESINVEGSLQLTATGITDVEEAVVRVGRALRLNAERIVLGDHADDFLGAERLNFQSTGVVDISSDVDIWLLGESRAREARLVATGGLFDLIRARTEITGSLTIQGASIQLGDDADDHFNAGFLTFNSDGGVEIHEDSDMMLIGSSRAEFARLTAAGSIEDAPVSLLSVISAEIDNRSDSQIYVNRKAVLVASGSIKLGESPNEAFTAGTVNFVAGGDVVVDHNGALFLTGNNVAENASLFFGSSLNDTANSTMELAGDLFVRGGNVQLGDWATDFLKASRFSFDLTGVLSLTADGDVLLYGDNSAAAMSLTSVGGTVSDEAGSTTQIKFFTSLTGEKVRIGLESRFATRSLTANATGNVSIHESDDMLLTGSSSANSFRLSSAGWISNTPGAVLDAAFRLDLTADLVNLGGFDDDLVSMRSLRFTTNDAMILDTDGDLLIVLDNTANSLILSSDGDIRDQPGSTIVINQFAYLSGVDLVLGDSPDECFDVLTDELFLAASGLSMVTEGC